MSRKDMVYVAKRFNRIHTYNVKTKEESALFDTMAAIVADMFEYGNSNFDRDRFFAAIYKCEDK